MMREILKKCIIDMIEEANAKQMDLIYRFIKGMLYGRDRK